MRKKKLLHAAPYCLRCANVAAEGVERVKDHDQPDVFVMARLQRLEHAGVMGMNLLHELCQPAGERIPDPLTERRIALQGKLEVPDRGLCRDLLRLHRRRQEAADSL